MRELKVGEIAVRRDLFDGLIDEFIDALGLLLVIREEHPDVLKKTCGNLNPEQKLIQMGAVLSGKTLDRRYSLPDAYPFETEGYVPQSGFDEPFMLRMIDDLRTTFPHKWGDIPDEDLKQFIQAGIEKANRYGVDLEVDVGLFLELATIYGADLDVNPRTAWAGEILRNPSLSGTEKMDRLDVYEFFELPNEDHHNDSHGHYSL